MTVDRKAFYGRLRHLTLPFAFQSLMLASVAAADALMLGSVDQVEMAAVSLATQIQFIQNMFLMAVTAGGAILGAQYWGKQDRKTMDELFCMILRLSGRFEQTNRAFSSQLAGRALKRSWRSAAEELDFPGIRKSMRPSARNLALAAISRKVS